MKALMHNLKFILLLSICIAFVNIPAESSAMPTESVSTLDEGAQKEALINKIMSVLDRPGFQAHLMTMGIDKAQLKEDLYQLDQPQLALVAEKAQDAKAAGDSAIGIAVGLLLIVLLVILIMYLVDHH